MYTGKYLSLERSGIIGKSRDYNDYCCLCSEDSDQPGHPPSLTRVFAVHMKKAWVLSYPLSAQRRLWSDWADAQADLSLCWEHTHFVGFVMSWLISCCFVISIWGMFVSTGSNSPNCVFNTYFETEMNQPRNQPVWKRYLLHRRTMTAQASCASAQPRQSLRCSLTQYKNLAKDSDKRSQLWP